MIGCMRNKDAAARKQPASDTKAFPSYINEYGEVKHDGPRTLIGDKRKNAKK